MKKMTWMSFFRCFFFFISLVECGSDCDLLADQIEFLMQVSLDRMLDSWWIIEVSVSLVAAACLPSDTLRHHFCETLPHPTPFNEKSIYYFLSFTLKNWDSPTLKQVYSFGVLILLKYVPIAQHQSLLYMHVYEYYIYVWQSVHFLKQAEANCSLLTIQSLLGFLSRLAKLKE